MAILKILSNKYETEEDVANVIDYCIRKRIYCGFGEIYNNCESVQEMAERLIVLKKLNGVSTERNMYHLIFSLDEYEVYSYLENSEEAKTYRVHLSEYPMITYR